MSTSAALLALALTIGAGDTPPDAPKQTAESAEPAHDESWTIRRVGGDMNVSVSESDGVFRSGARIVQTPLPEGYPRPTPPGAIELKKYPSVRAAEVSGDSSLSRGMNQGFFPLFRHIKSRGIAMTAPVEMEIADADENTETRWSMAFLYRKPDLGPTGEAEEGVRVFDSEPLIALSIGIGSPTRSADIDAAVETLSDWLGVNAREWRRAGQTRVLAYNAPMIPAEQQWTEVQIPVERITMIGRTTTPDPANPNDSTDDGT